MEPNLVGAKKTLIWSLDFINLDLSRLSEKDLFALGIEIRDRVYGERGFRFISDESLVKWEERRKEARVIQDSMKKYLDAILKNRATSSSPKSSARIPGVPSTTVGRKKPPKLGEFLEQNSGKAALFSIPHQIGVYRIGERVFTLPMGIEEKLTYDFITALSYFPISLIQKCHREECGGYFLKATKKEKRYCSKRCAWILASKRHYESQPEVLKAKRREYYRRMKEIVSIGPGVKKR
jgi:hypothetical protein